MSEPITISELARNIEQWGSFFTGRKPGHMRIRLCFHTPDRDFAYRFAEEYRRKVYYYPKHAAHPYTVGVTQTPTARVCAASHIKFGCEPHRKLAEMLIAASDIGEQIQRKSHFANIQGRNLPFRSKFQREIEELKEERERILTRAFELLDKKTIYTACPVRAARAIDKTNQSMVQC